ncbi:hypothetical protein SFRURICE_018792 [Spodoptera frugiperda]|nr:hypothetical protein SFRURICE_018792 [Spodoptera frugiperda]
MCEEDAQLESSMRCSDSREVIHSTHLKHTSIARIHCTKVLKANPPLTSVTGDHHGVQCVNQILSN